MLIIPILRFRRRVIVLLFRFYDTNKKLLIQSTYHIEYIVYILPFSKLVFGGALKKERFFLKKKTKNKLKKIVFDVCYLLVFWFHFVIVIIRHFWNEFFRFCLINNNETNQPAEIDIICDCSCSCWPSECSRWRRRTIKTTITTKMINAKMPPMTPPTIAPVSEIDIFQKNREKNIAIYQIWSMLKYWQSIVMNLMKPLSSYLTLSMIVLSSLVLVTVMIVD